MHCIALRYITLHYVTLYTLHSYINTLIHTYLHTCMHACIHTYMRTCGHAYMHTCIHAYMHAYMYTCIHACIHAYMHTCIHTYIHACMNTYIHTEKESEDPGARKGSKVAKRCVFPMIWVSGGSKSRLAKAAGAEPAGQMRDEKLHAVVARSTCPSQNVQSTPCSDHFWKLRCRKSARRCGAKRVCKWKS